MKSKLLKFLRHFFWFGIAGVFGFIVDAVVLYALKNSLGLYEARGFSFISAVMATWLFNRTITFRQQKSGHSTAKEFLIYFALMLVGGSVNYSIYALLVTHCELFNAQPVLAVAVGSIAGMIINLLASRFILFRFSR